MKYCLKEWSYYCFHKNWQMPHPRAEVFWQIPHRRDRQDHKYPTNGTTTTIIIKFINEMASTRKWHFHFRKLPSLRLFCYEYFPNKRIKRRMAFQQLAGVALPCEQRLHFRCVSWRAKSFAWQLTQRKCSLCSQGRVAFAITRCITFQSLTFYNLLAYRD